MCTVFGYCIWVKDWNNGRKVWDYRNEIKITENLLDVSQYKQRDEGQKRNAMGLFVASK